MTFNSLHGHVHGSYLKCWFLESFIMYGLRLQDDLTPVAPEQRGKRWEIEHLDRLQQNCGTHYPKMCAAATTLAFLKVT